MKNPKRPTVKQKKLIASHGLNVDSFLVVKNLSEYIEIVKVIDLKKYRNENTRIKTRKLYKEGADVTRL